MTPHRPARLIAELKRQGIENAHILNVMQQIPREKFLAPGLQGQAYDNSALPIGESQTISQPFVVARMTELLDPQPKDKILEIGTGCGYQTAILCKLGRRVFSIERFEILADSATKRLQSLGFHNFVTMAGDGTLGWPQQAPFDAIMVTAAGPSVPQALQDQLAEGGRLVMPVADQSRSAQVLTLVEKMADGTITHTTYDAVQFVPLVGEQGVPEKQKRA